MKLDETSILELFKALEARLRQAETVGELYVVGGAAMCLAFHARPSTYDVDAVFAPAALVRRLAAEVTAERGVDDRWLNDAVKGYLSDRGESSQWLDLPYLKVYMPTPEYLLAMKCVAMRLGPEFHDESDVRYLLRYLNVETYSAAMAIVERFFPPARIPLKSAHALKEILTK